MIGKNVTNSRPATLSEVYEILETRRGEGEMGYEQQACLNYVRKFNKLEKADADELYSELMKVDEMKESTATKIVDILPEFESQLKVLLQRERTELSESNFKSARELVLKFRERMKEPEPEIQIEGAPKEVEEAIEEKAKEEEEEKVVSKEEVKNLKEKAAPGEEKEEKQEKEKEKAKKAKKGESKDESKKDKE